MMTVRNEIKAQIVRAGYTMQELVDRLHEEYGWPTGWKHCPTSRIPHEAGQLPPAWCIPPGRSVP